MTEQEPRRERISHARRTRNGDRHAAPTEAEKAGMDKLRELLAIPAETRIREIEDRLDSPDLMTEGVARALPGAMESKRDDAQLVAAMTPTIENVLQESVRRNPQPMIDAIFPIIGPAIRKAITHTVGTMVQTINRGVEHTFTAKGIKWRLEAWRTGRPFGEIVLAHSLVFRVEQVLLVHRNTGLPLEHVSVPGLEAKDPDLVSGMMIAIQDFVRDSFTEGGTQELDSFRVGEFSVLVDHGPYAVVAAVVRGAPPRALRRQIVETTERIHADWVEPLRAFDGDAAPFAPTRTVLETLLVEQAKDAEKKKGGGWVGQFVVFGTLAALLIFGVFWWVADARREARFAAYVEDLRTTPGIVVMRAEERDGVFEVAGLRDPMAVDPQALLQKHDMQSDSVRAAWQTFASSHDEFLLKRVTALLDPPSLVRLSVEDGTVVASGFATASWVTEAKRMLALMPAVRGFRPPTQLAELGGHEKAVEAAVVRFERGGAELDAKAKVQVTLVRGHLATLDEAATRMNLQVIVRISGHSDDSGTAETNERISQARAESVATLLRQHEWTTTRFEAKGHGASSPDEAMSPSDDRQRRVTFRIVMQEKTR